MNQFELSALLKFTNGVSIGESAADAAGDDDCYWWPELESKGLIIRAGTWFSVTEAGLRVIALCTSCASEAYMSLKMGGFAK